MKIIKSGNLVKQEPVQPWWFNKQIRCKGCECIFTLEDKDIKSNDYSYYFKYQCPSCKKTLLIVNPKTPFWKRMFKGINKS